MAKFKLFWENRPETPLDANRLSSFIDHYSKDSIIYSDHNNFLPNGDGKLKIRDLTKVNHISYQTLGAFDFNRTLTSFNSMFAPSQQRDIIYREEYYDREGSVAFDEAITNLLTNPGFENDGTDWVFFRGDNLNEEENPDIDSTIEYVTEDYFPKLNLNNLKSAKITTGGYFGTSRLIKYVNAPEEVNRVSLSFYYKAESESFFTIKSGTVENPEFWNDVSGWLPSSKEYLLEATSEWKRVELPQIFIGDKNNVRIEINISQIESEYYFDSFLLEDKSYCSSYFYRDTESTILSYNSDIINYKKGLIDFIFYPKYKGDKNTFFALKTSNVNNDAIKLEYDGINNRFVISVFDTYNSSYIENYVPMGYDSFINRWNRIIFNWNMNTKKVQFSIVKLPIPEETESFDINEDDIYEFTLPNGDSYLFDEDDIADFYIGSNAGAAPARSLIEFFKINKEDKTTIKVLEDLNRIYSFIDKPIFRMFESPYYSIELNESLLDENSFTPNTKYYVWLGDNRDDDSCNIIISTSPRNPKGYRWFDSSIIGGFHTTDSNEIDITSFWDRSTNLTDTFHTNRLLIGNTRTRNIDDTSVTTRETPIEFRTNDIEHVSLPEDATFNIDTYFTKHVYGRNRTDGNYLDIDNANGEVFLDNLHFDGYTINSIGSNLEIFAESPNTLNLHSQEIILNSEGTDIKLDDLRIVDNILYTKDGVDLFINTKRDGNNNFLIHTDELNIDSGRIVSSTTSDYQITTGSNMTVNTTTDFIVNSGSVIRLDDLIIDDNVLYRDSNFQLKSNSSYVEIEDIKFNNNKIFYGDETKRFIEFYTDGGVENIDIVSDNLVKIDSPKFEVTASEIYFHADVANLFKLENLRIDQNKLFTDPGVFLLLGGEGTELSDRVYVKSLNSINLNSQHVEVNSNTVSFNIGLGMTFDNLRINDNTFDSIDGQMNIGNNTYKTYITGNGIEIRDFAGSTLFSTNVEITNSLGIGTSNPFGKIHIYNNSSDSISIIDSADSYNSRLDLITQTDNGALGTTGIKGWSLEGIGNSWTEDAARRNDLRLRNWNGSWLDVLYVKPSGRIGVGTYQPQQKFEVHDGNVRVHNTSTTIELFNDADTVSVDDNWAIHYNNNGNLFFMKNDSSTGSYKSNLMLKTDGTAVFGDVDTQGYVLRVNGTGKFENYVGIGDVTPGESHFQSNSATMSGKGFLETPWINVQGGIEAAGEKGSQSTGIFFNDGMINSSTDTISFVTNGVSRMKVHNDGGVSVGNSGRFVGGQVTPSNEGDITYNGDFWAYRVYNAVWMDLAECWKKDENYTFEYGMTVVQTKNGIKPSTKRAEKGTVGILSNTYGYILGAKNFDENDFAGSKSLPVAISGRVEASYEGKLEIGDEVVSTKRASVTRVNLIEKIIKRDRIIGRVDGVIDDKRCKIKVY